MARRKMTSNFMRRSLPVTFIILSVAAAMAAVLTDPAEQNPTDGGLGPVRIDGDRPAANDQFRGGNPLWAISLKGLSATHERPIFSPSRRPPPSAVAVTSYVQPAKPQEPERPQLSLVGTVAGKESFGI